MVFYTFWRGVAIEMEVFFGCLWVCGRYLWLFGHLHFFIRMSKNGSSFELCSKVNFILGCRFCSRLCNSLLFSYGHFQNMKQSSKYFFHDLVNSPFILLPYFLSIISYRFSSKYARVRIAYVGAILVPIAIPSVWI